MTPAGTSNELDVQNECEENTHTLSRYIQTPKKKVNWVFTLEEFDMGDPKRKEYAIIYSMRTAEKWPTCQAASR